ncbi:MAG: ribonucleoside-diphosphate reductase subunit alpha [Bacillota bacterium]
MTIITKQDGKRQLVFDEPRLLRFIQEATKEHPNIEGLEDYTAKVLRTVSSKETYKASQITNLLIMQALDRVGSNPGQDPKWTFVAAYVYLKDLYKQASRNRVYDASSKYGSLYALIRTLTEKGIYTPDLLKHYSKEEIQALEKMIDPERDRLLSYLGVRTLKERYIATDHDKNIYELPQERWLVIAMTLMMLEDKSKRLDLIAESYWALSNLFMTVATPTMANSGKTVGQLSSCFISTPDDDLRSIYDDTVDAALLSKGAGGIGTYYGKVRSRGSNIKHFKGVASGTAPFIRSLESVASAVDQLGTRKGSIAVYQDSWHKDIFLHLDARLNNGDDRFKYKDIFTGICIPDLFMEKVEKREDWYLFDPHEIRQVMGFSLEDYYDEEFGNGTFRRKYQECVDHPLLSRERVSAIEVMKAVMKSQLETGTPYMFYRDEANRMNPNKKYHEDGTAKTSIYCSNLCSEIFQAMSPTTIVEEVIEGDMIITYKKAGDFVVCNLSSISTSKAVGRKGLKESVLPRLIKIQVRMLDNVIDLNETRIPVKQAIITNRKYRAVGLGQSGWHQLLAIRGIKWESEEAVQFSDELNDFISFHTIKASMELSKEKGSYPLFPESDWANGDYFSLRGYDSDEWLWLAEEVRQNGIRNGLIA